MRAVIDKDSAQLFVDDAEQPALIIDRTKVASNETGTVALWIGLGTWAEFKDLEVTPAPQPQSSSSS